MAAERSTGLLCRPFFVDGQSYAWGLRGSARPPTGYTALSQSAAAQLIGVWCSTSNIEALEGAARALDLDAQGHASDEGVAERVGARLLEHVASFSVLYAGRAISSAALESTTAAVGETPLASLADASDTEPEPWQWVEIVVLGPEDEPVAGVECEIILPDGQVRRHKSDEFGLVRVEQISEAGACKVSFPGAGGSVEAV